MNNGNLWGLRLLAVALAVSLWFIVSVESREPTSEKVVEAPVTYKVPKGFIILNPIETVRVRLRGTESSIRSVNPFLVAAIVDVSEARIGSTQISLGPENISGPAKVDVVSVEPSLISLSIDELTTGMLPVEARLVGEPAAGAIVLDPVVFPGQVSVRGPRSRLRQTISLQTSPVDLTGHALNFEEQAAVVSPDSLISVLQPVIVTVKVPMQIPGAAGDDDAITAINRN